MIAAMSDIYVRHFVATVDKNDVPKAFRIVERARGRSVADLLWQHSSDRPSKPVDTSADRQIGSLQVQLMRADNRRRREELLGQLFEAEQRHALAVTGHFKPYSVRRPVSLQTMQRALLKEELLIEYVIADPESYCLVATRSRAQLVPLRASRQRIEILVTDYLTQERARKSGEDKARQLYALLFGPIQALGSNPRIVVIPDGILHLLPFDALRTPSGKYLLESSVVTYAPSATVLQFLRTSHKSAAPTLPFLGVGDVAYDSEPPKERNQSDGATDFTTRGLYDLGGADFQPLPGTREEVLSASRIFGPRSVVLLGSEATEAAFKREPLAEFRVLHLAVHGISNPKFPERAALVLGRDYESREDGLLQAREISNLVLNADLVTLSACNTDVGRLQGEEGIANLQRAFLLAGAKSTVATLWSADDTFTAALITQFYRYLAEGTGKGSHLWRAKRYR